MRRDGASDIGVSIIGSSFTGVETCRSGVDVLAVVATGFFLCDRVPLLLSTGVDVPVLDL